MFFKPNFLLFTHLQLCLFLTLTTVNHVLYNTRERERAKDRERERERKREREGKREPEVKYKGYHNWEGSVTWGF